jgi:hypothetical protein
MVFPKLSVLSSTESAGRRCTNTYGSSHFRDRLPRLARYDHRWGRKVDGTAIIGISKAQDSAGESASDQLSVSSRSSRSPTILTN